MVNNAFVITEEMNHKHLTCHSLIFIKDASTFFPSPSILILQDISHTRFKQFRKRKHWNGWGQIDGRVMWRVTISFWYNLFIRSVSGEYFSCTGWQWTGQISQLGEVEKNTDKSLQRGWGREVIWPKIHGPQWLNVLTHFDNTFLPLQSHSKQTDSGIHIYYPSTNTINYHWEGRQTRRGQA